MEKIKKQEKQEIYGGVGEMAGWIVLTGLTLLISTVASFFKQEKTTYTTTNKDGSKTTTTTYKANSSNAYLRVSPMPGRSSVMIGI
jgi:hypothetical protein